MTELVEQVVVQFRMCIRASAVENPERYRTILLLARAAMQTSWMEAISHGTLVVRS
jgi:hypothetical protein